MTNQGKSSVARKPTLGTVAQAAGVSIPTVSQVLRGTGRISHETRARVLTAAQQLHYVPDSRAAAMRSGENREIGFVINQLQNPFNAEVIGGVVDLLEAQSYLVSVVDTRDDPSRQRRQLETFIKHGRGGLLWVPARANDGGKDESEDDAVLQMLKAQNIPTVTFMRQVDPAFDHVGLRDADATREATTHLIDLGHRRFAYLGGTQMTSVRQDRIAGFHSALAARGRGDAVVWSCVDNKRAGLEAMQGLLAENPDITAVICNGDMVAIGACLALIRMGMTPGREVSVIGFDDIEDAAVATPPLTTMAVHPHRLGHELARMLLARIDAPQRPTTVTKVSAELVARETTGRPIGLG